MHIAAETLGKKENVSYSLFLLLIETYGTRP